MNKKLSIFLLILCLGNIFVSAQDAKEKSALTGLTLEVMYYKGIPPGYSAVGDSVANAKGGWFAAFRRIANFQHSADMPPVKAVNFRAYQEKDAVKVSISVFLGRLHENEKPVGVYTLRENEKIVVKELTDFGVEPFEIAVVRVSPSVAGLPSVENKTNSLQVTDLEPKVATLPAFKFRLLNNSEKAVSSFSFEILTNGEKRITGLREGEKGKSLIEPGESFEMELKIPLERKKISEGEVPPAQPNLTLVMTSATFTDGSFQGEILPAARVRAFELGRKLQLKQIISLIETSEKNQKQFDSNTFAEQALNLKVTVDEIEFNKLLKDFPDLSEKDKSLEHTCVELASQQIKKIFTGELENRIKKSDSIQNWLAETKKDYQNWLARIF